MFCQIFEEPASNIFLGLEHPRRIENHAKHPSSTLKPPHCWKNKGALCTQSRNSSLETEAVINHVCGSNIAVASLLHSLAFSVVTSYERQRIVFVSVILAPCSHTGTQAMAVVSATTGCINL